MVTLSELEKQQLEYYANGVGHMTTLWDLKKTNFSTRCLGVLGGSGGCLLLVV